MTSMKVFLLLDILNEDVKSKAMIDGAIGKSHCVEESSEKQLDKFCPNISTKF